MDCCPCCKREFRDFREYLKIKILEVQVLDMPERILDLGEMLRYESIPENIKKGFSTGLKEIIDGEFIYREGVRRCKPSGEGTFPPTYYKYTNITSKVKNLLSSPAITDYLKNLRDLVGKKIEPAKLPAKPKLDSSRFYLSLVEDKNKLLHVSLWGSVGRISMEDIICNFFDLATINYEGIIPQLSTQQ